MGLVDAFKKRRRKFVKYAGGWAIRKLENIVRSASTVGNPPVFNNDEFSWVKDIEVDWDLIRQEAEYVVSLREDIPAFQDISTDQKALNQDDKWKTFFFYGMGLKNDSGCRICPETTKLVEKIPNMKTAFFSILMPKKEIPKHRGMFNAFLRYHLGLIIPEPMKECGINIDGKTYHWKPGESLIFDDTYDHYAWNRTDGIRVILFVDVMRPMKNPWDYLFNQAVKAIANTGFVQDAKKNMVFWEAKLKDVPPAPIKPTEPTPA